MKTQRPIVQQQVKPPEQPNALPTLEAVVRGSDDEWIVQLDYGGYVQMLVVTTDELRHYHKFQRKCMERLHRCFARVKPDEWERRVDEGMRRGHL